MLDAPDRLTLVERLKFWKDIGIWYRNRQRARAYRIDIEIEFYTTLLAQPAVRAAMLKAAVQSSRLAYYAPGNALHPSVEFAVRLFTYVDSRTVFYREEDSKKEAEQRAIHQFVQGQAQLRRGLFWAAIAALVVFVLICRGVL